MYYPNSRGYKCHSLLTKKFHFTNFTSHLFFFVAHSTPRIVCENIVHRAHSVPFNLGVIEFSFIQHSNL